MRQPDFERFLKQVIKDIKIELDDEFDRNFELKAFFDTPWLPAKMPTNKGSLMLRTGATRHSLRSDIHGHVISYTSSLPQAGLHNEGGTITVTARMKKYFWAMYYRASGAINQRLDGRDRNTIRNRALTQDAQYWKSLALIKIGSKIIVPQRQFIGAHAQVDAAVKRVADENAKELEEQIRQQLQRAGNH